jgi:NADH-quinone oxidoreductase subunit L
MVGCGLPIAAFAWRSGRSGHEGSRMDARIDDVYSWLVAGDNRFDVAFYLDRLSAVMVLIVTGVGSLIHLYSTGYMKEDKSYARYFAYLNLFLFFMLLLVLGRSMLVLFVGWEGSGSRRTC